MNAARTLLQDTWRGLVQRRLWPVAALLLVALVAVPVALRTEPEPAPAPARDQVAGDSAELASEPIVGVASASEREDVRRVLGKRKDPFRPTNQPRREPAQQATADTADSADGVSEPTTNEAAGSSGAASGGTTTTITPAAPAPAPPPRATPEPDEPERSTHFLTIRWGSSEDEELERRNIERLDAVPTTEEPVVIYLGLTDKGRTAVFMIDAGASAQGDGRCRPDPANCATIELSEGETEFFDVEDEDGTVSQYQLDVVRIHAPDAKGASAARRARAARAVGRRSGRFAERRAARVAGARAVLRSLERGELGFRYDERTGLLEILDEES